MKNKVNFLVGDIGNTLIKICFLNNNLKIIKSFTIETKKIYLLNEKKKFLKKILISDLSKKILFSSVVPAVFQILKNSLKKKNFRLYEIKNLKIKNLLKFNVDNLRQVGSDRIANSIGAYTTYKNNCLVIDFGTATTFDVIKKVGIYDGGVIAPGIKLSINNLNKFTAQLPTLKLKNKSSAYGKNTIDALNAGFLWGYQGLINNIINKINSTSINNYKIILTGGYASFFKKYLKKKSIIDENITIKGLIKIYKEFLL